MDIVNFFLVHLEKIWFDKQNTVATWNNRPGNDNSALLSAHNFGTRTSAATVGLTSTAVFLKALKCHYWASFKRVDLPPPDMIEHYSEHIYSFGSFNVNINFVIKARLTYPQLPEYVYSTTIRSRTVSRIHWHWQYIYQTPLWNIWRWMR